MSVCIYACLSTAWMYDYNMFLLCFLLLGFLVSLLLVLTQTDTSATTLAQEIARVTTVLFANSIFMSICNGLTTLLARSSRSHHDHSNNKNSKVESKLHFF
ncbi:hypothetical protein BD560DRAFT_403419 [Blakeslea trispora]|nr:hypothetical protein BD560DRAFT_403419 [Blakeslea trispora]